MTKEMMVPSYDGTKLFFRKDVPESPKAIVVVVHGLCEHLGRYNYVTEKLNRSGFGVYRFDHRGHGKSEGRRVFFHDYNEMVDDVNHFVEMAKMENKGLPVFLLGHSMGGCAVTLFGTKYPGKVQGIVTSGALTRMNAAAPGSLPIPQPADAYFPNELGDGVCSDPAVVKAYEDDPLVEKQISVGLFNALYYGVEWMKKNAKKFTDPVLLLHGCCDGLVSEKDSREFFGDIASSDKTLKIYAHLYHEILNEPCRDEIIAEIVDWLNKRL
ncbi:lysophospholipase [Caproiciproducens galactitolivorans]|uniref:Phospholipase YtpA n=1 Tax=Caproiciproducens galactitolivorans TaxID=642589 RepID=A0A4Z0Y1W9_9FIRM|nr:alpha/beta hydrolase [Caproiciproducens galactitolivorans]QEY35156.1 lysophospholipase [Caproiciproducens galactitolivorans]TGJ76847.1 phospholipase YtpA [Caproiciproducens galactitolivorans]